MPCITPFMKKHKELNCNVAVPCGKCPECLKRRVSGWSFRLMQEEKTAQSARFITLTYDTIKVPITPSGYMSLNKKHIQDFFKRLRRQIEYAGYPLDIPVKYYIVGEYGGKTNRPHYHALIYNVPDTKFLETAWDMGAIHYGDVTGASIGYTLKYISKPGRIPMHRNDDRLPEFSLMSKRLGESYLSSAIINWHKADLLNRFHLTIEGGKKIAMPRYYKDKLYPKNSLGISPERQLIAEHLIPLMDQKLLEAIRDNPSHFRDLAELHKQQFIKNASDGLKRDKL